MKVVELAVKAGRKRQSEITRFVHDETREAIPIYENFCFALALLRTRTAENVLEAKALLEKLMAFQVSGEFPVYLHEYPICRYAGLNSKLYPVVYFILKEFSPVLGDLRQKLQTISASLPEISPETPEECAEYLIHAQITGADKTPALQSWDPQKLCFIGPQKQERGEPALTLYDLFMGQWGGQFSTRALADHPAHLRAALIYPAEVTCLTPVAPSTHFFWGEGNPTHSMVLQTQGRFENNTVYLPEKEVHDEMEIVYYYNLHPETYVLINGQKATSFQLGDKVELISKGFKREIIFSGEGKFWGHLFCSNRPGQLSCKGDNKHEAFDGAIGLRTVHRTRAAEIQICVR